MIRYFIFVLPIIFVQLPAVAPQTPTACTTNAQCPVTQICFNIVGTGGFCITNPNFPNATTATTTPSATVSPQSECPSYYYYDKSTKSCYAALRSPMEYSAADSLCKSTGGFVVQPRNAAINSAAKFLYNYGSTTPNPLYYWIGLKNLYSTWVWPTLSNTTTTSSDPFNSFQNPYATSNPFDSVIFPEYTNWASGYPSSPATATCVVVDYSSNSGYWYNVPCTNVRSGAVCQKNLTAF